MQLLSIGNNTVDMVDLDFAKSLDKVDHGVLLHKIKMLDITGKLGVWLYNFLTGRTHFVRLQGGVIFDSPVISGVPQGTVLGPLLFIILMCDINSGITSSSIVSFADDTRLEYGISNVDDAILQNDLNSVYEWASDNNMLFNAQNSNMYVLTLMLHYLVMFTPVPGLYIIDYCRHVLDIGIYVSSDCSFEFLIRLWLCIDWTMVPSCGLNI